MSVCQISAQESYSKASSDTRFDILFKSIARLDVLFDTINNAQNIFKESLDDLWEDHAKKVGEIEFICDLVEKMKIRGMDFESIIEDFIKLKSDYYGAPRWDLKGLYDRVEELDKRYGYLNDNLGKGIDNVLEPNINMLHSRLDKLEERLSDLINMPNIAWAKYNKTPHKCPVCNGDGVLILEGHVLTSYPPQYPTKKCIPCDGSGIIWG